MPYRPFECLIDQLSGKGGLLRPRSEISEVGQELGSDGLWRDSEATYPKVTKENLVAAFFPSIGRPLEGFRNLPGSREGMLTRFLKDQGRQQGILVPEAEAVLPVVYDVLERDDERSIWRIVDWPDLEPGPEGEDVPFYAGAGGRAFIERLAEEFRLAHEDPAAIGRFRETAFWLQGLCAQDYAARSAFLVHLFASCLLGPESYAGEMSYVFRWARHLWAGRGTRVCRAVGRAAAAPAAGSAEGRAGRVEGLAGRADDAEGQGEDCGGRVGYRTYVGRGGAEGDWSLQEVDFDQGPAGGYSTVGAVRTYRHGEVVRIGTAVMEGEGRALGVPVSKEFVSRLHATLRSDGHAVTVEDEGSTGGTLVIRHLGALDGTPASYIRLGAASAEAAPAYATTLVQGDIVVLAPDIAEDGSFSPNNGEAAFRFRVL